MGFIADLFRSPKPPVVISPPAPLPAPVAAPKTKVEEVIDTFAEDAATAEVKKLKRKRGYAKTILTSGFGIEEKAPVIKKKLGA